MTHSPFLDLRRRFVSRPLLAMVRRVMPPMSATEREAIEAGTTWWDADLFSGRPDWNKLLATPKPALNKEEQAFLDGPVEELCRMLDEWKINFELRDLPPDVWRFLAEKGFFGMIIPKEHGGLGFSALGHSAVVMKIATRSITAAVTVMVPNSLGPAELLLRYGTDAQQKYYLPRLAKGQEIPCFGLTGPWNGSDAASMPDRGIVCYGEHQGKRTLGLRVSWEKRYITLGPVATLLGLAFRAEDPDGLLGGERELGITVALVPTKTPGVKIGRRHLPAGQAFQNGPNSGKDVFIPMGWVIGGQDRVGQGWRMLMDSLAAGRSISLPSMSTGATKYAARVTGAYARIRKQFGVPVGKFEGIEEPLARIAGNAYVLDAMRRTTAGAVDLGEKPAVLSAIAKYHATERMREAVNDAMDVHGGKGICDGPSNYLVNAYYALPVAITVEGANILTRSMIIFGQGAIRCHPWLLKELRSAHAEDRKQGLAEFDHALFGHIGHIFATLGRAVGHNLTGGRFARAPADAGAEARCYRQLSRASASFALVAEVALLGLGGRLKRMEGLSARLGDILSEMYLLSCALKRFADEGRPEADVPLLRYVVERGLFAIQQRLDEVLQNFRPRAFGVLLRPLVFPWGRRFRKPDDRLVHACATLVLEPSEARDRLTAGIFIGAPSDVGTGQLDHALEAVVAADEIERKIRDAGGGTPEQATRAGIISRDEAKRVESARTITRDIIMVDDFAPSALGARRKGDRLSPQKRSQKRKPELVARSG